METGLTRALSVIARSVPETEAPPRVEPGPRPSMGNETPRVRAFVPEVAVDVSMGQGGPQPLPSPTPPVAPEDQTEIPLADAQVILAGLRETLRLVDTANETGWKCVGADQSAFYKARVLRDRLEAFVGAAKPDSTFSLSKVDLDAAEKVLACSDEATARTPNTSAYIAVGVLVAGAALFLSMT